MVTPPPVAARPRTLSLALVGDVLPLWVTDPFHDGQVRHLLRSADVTFGNLEGPLSKRGHPSPLKFRDGQLMHREFIFGAEPAAAKSLFNAGFDVVSLANNHAMDHGITALDDTFAALKRYGIASAGAGADLAAARCATVIERNAIRIAFLAYVSDETLPGTEYFAATATEGGLAFVRRDRLSNPDTATLKMLREDIAYARQRADVVIVSCHWGIEFQPQPTAFQRELAHAAIEMGADAVVGHHPHCLQGIECYKGKPIFYSLGDFVFHSKMAICNQSGIALATVSKRGIERVVFHPVWIEQARPSWNHAKATEAAIALHALSRAMGTTTYIARSQGRPAVYLDIPPKTNTATKRQPVETTTASKTATAARLGHAASPLDFVDVEHAVHDIVVELRYATLNNVFKTRLYRSNRCLLRRGTAAKLNKAQGLLARHQLRLKIWDGYRPLSVQRKMWNRVHDARYVANPARGGSRHNRGCAVDVTLVDRYGRELEMPTGYDDFSPRARMNYAPVSPMAKQHRALLQRVMKAAGFVPLTTEWWHFDDSVATRYPIE
jgi:D-alanyl-D-alanine dipeptidase/poly-gamma-glutamate capsule biosynthesis protein CapA/YwtB (metallophosphatase superfamily)